jgi:hypothetical protein
MFRRLVFAAATALTLVSPLVAQESSALLNALIRKGILTQQEAEEIRTEVAKEHPAPSAPAVPLGKATERLSIGMRMQVQYASLDTDVAGAAAGPAATDHAFLRRMYLTLKAGLGAWGAQFTYDFAGGGYDDAIIYWKPSQELVFDFGLRKVNVGYEERRTSGDLRAIERSGVTRYFVEANNGRRLGAASYRIGAFMNGKRDLPGPVDLVYGAAITTPERNETFALAAASGDATNNRFAYWANAGATGKFAPQHSSWLVGAGIGFLPDQGGFGANNLGRGHDLAIYSLHADVTAGRFGFLGEYLAAEVERGRADNRNQRDAPWFFCAAHLSADADPGGGGPLPVARFRWTRPESRRRDSLSGERWDDEHLHRMVRRSELVRARPRSAVPTGRTVWGDQRHGRRRPGQSQDGRRPLPSPGPVLAGASRERRDAWLRTAG